MDEKPLISVIMPVYNGESYLAEAIESALAQDYLNIEVILIDDGSTDNSWDIAQRYPGLILIQKENGGVASARNCGLRQAQGSLCAFLDQDDVWAKNKLSVQWAALQSDSNLGFVVCNCRHFIDPQNPPPPIRKEVTEKDQKTYIPSSWLIWRRILEQMGGFDESFRCGDDTNLMFKLKDAGISYTCCPELLLYRRFHNRNTSHNYPGGYSAQELLLTLRASLQRKLMKD